MPNSISSLAKRSRRYDPGDRRRKLQLAARGGATTQFLPAVELLVAGLSAPPLRGRARPPPTRGGAAPGTADWAIDAVSPCSRRDKIARRPVLATIRLGLRVRPTTASYPGPSCGAPTPPSATRGTTRHGSRTRAPSTAPLVADEKIPTGQRRTRIGRRFQSRPNPEPPNRAANQRVLADRKCDDARRWHGGTAELRRVVR